MSVVTEYIYTYITTVVTEYFLILSYGQYFMLAKEKIKPTN